MVKHSLVSKTLNVLGSALVSGTPTQTSRVQSWKKKSVDHVFLSFLLSEGRLVCTVDTVLGINRFPYTDLLVFAGV